MSQFQQMKAPYGVQWLDHAARGFEYMGGAELTAVNANIPATGGVTVTIKDQFFIVGRVTSFSAASTLSMQVGSSGTIDVGNNYRHRNIVGPGGNALGITTYYNISAGTTNQWNVAYNSTQAAHSDTGTVNALVFFALIGNAAGVSKTASWSQARGTAAAGTAGKLFTGAGEYINAANSNARLNTFKLKVTTGTATMGIDSGFGIWGRDFP